MLLCHSFICQQRCQKTSPVGLLQCLATKHLSPNAFKWFSRAGKAWVFGRDGDAFLYLRSLPQREVLLGSILADGRKLKENILFLENCSSMECSLQGCVLDALALPTSRGGLVCSKPPQPALQDAACPHADTVVVLTSWIWSPKND